MELTFGKVIRQARQDKGYSQRQLAKLLRIDFTYLSKLENDRADYAAKEEVIRSLAKQLEIEEEELIFLAGRLPQHYEAFLKQHHRHLPRLLGRMLESPGFADRVFRAAIGQEEL